LNDIVFSLAEKTKQRKNNNLIYYHLDRFIRKGFTAIMRFFRSVFVSL